MTRSAFELPLNNIQLNNGLFLRQTGLSQSLCESTGGSPQIIGFFGSQRTSFDQTLELLALF